MRLEPLVKEIPKLHTPDPEPIRLLKGLTTLKCIWYRWPMPGKVLTLTNPKP
jgi:hypothetical protein